MILRVSHFKAQSSYEALLSIMNSLLFLYCSHCILSNILALPQLWDLVLSFSSISVQFWLQLKEDFLRLEYSRPKWIDSVVWADTPTVHHLSPLAHTLSSIQQDSNASLHTRNFLALSRDVFWRNRLFIHTGSYILPLKISADNTYCMTAFTRMFI